MPHARGDEPYDACCPMADDGLCPTYVGIKDMLRLSERENTLFLTKPIHYGDYSKEYSKEPEIDIKTIQKTNQKPEIDQKTDQKAETNQKTIQKTDQILRVLREKPKTTQRECAERLKWSLSITKYYFNILQKKGILHRIGTNRSGHWEILTKEAKGDA